MTERRVGVEEELFLANPDSGLLRPVSDRTLRADNRRRQTHDGESPIQQELFLEQIETATTPCLTLTELEAEHHGATARENLICGTYVHVETTDEDEAVAALDRIRPWLPILLALSANSPFWHGEDTGYASFRAQVVSRWPSAGPTEPFGSAANYHAVIDELIRTTAALDEAMIYFDARLAVRYPTLEIRIADVCTELSDTVLVAALARALVETAVREAAEGIAVPTWRTELLRAATWQASRWGMSRNLVHPIHRDLRPAFDVVTALVDHVGPALETAGDTDLVRAVLDDLRIRGTGSVRQRAVYARHSHSADVILDAVERTRATYI